MWLAAKYGSERKSRGKGVQPGGSTWKPLTLKDLDEYSALKAEFPDVDIPSYDERGLPDEVSHLKLLRDLKQQQSEPEAEPEEEVLPRRAPGEALSESPPPPMRGRDLPQRVPGRDPSEVSYAPRIPSIPEWVERMRDKGISLNHRLERPDAARPEDMVGPTQGWGRQHIQEFSRPPRQEPDVPAPDPVDVRLLQNQRRDTSLERPRIFRRRRTSAVVADYIEHVLVAVGSSQEDALRGWDREDSGSGVSYTKRIGDKVHVLNSQPDGWIHNSGPSADEMSENPRFYDDLGQAMLRAHGVGDEYRAKPPMSRREMN